MEEVQKEEEQEAPVEEEAEPEEQGIIREAVSYTHLDVYKRQKTNLATNTKDLLILSRSL